PDVTWNDGFGATGGGKSHVFSRPAYQHGVRNVVGASRGTPDISMSAAVDGGAWVYYTFVGANSPWHIFGGTSEARPIFSGLRALAHPPPHRPLGDIHNAPYLLGAATPHPPPPTPARG